MAWCVVILGINKLKFDGTSRLGKAVRGILENEAAAAVAAAEKKPKSRTAAKAKRGAPRDAPLTKPSPESLLLGSGIKFRNAAEKRHAAEIEKILRSNDVKKLKACIIGLCSDLALKKRSCDEKASLLAALKKDKMELDALNAKAEWFKYEEERCIKRLKAGGQDDDAPEPEKSKRVKAGGNGKQRTDKSNMKKAAGGKKAAPKARATKV